MSDSLERIENKLDKIRDKIASIDATLASQHVSLVEHIKRTEILEGKLEPVEAHIKMLQGAGNLLKWIAIICAVITGIAKVLKII